MLDRIRAAVCRIDIIQDGKSVARGSGTLISEGVVITAFHVIGDRRADPPAVYPGEIRVTFPGSVTQGQLFAPYFDARTDWALLKLAEAPAVRPAPLAPRCDNGVPWETYGFPDANPRDGMVQTGNIENYHGELEGCQVLQLFSKQAAAGAGAPVKGLSGGPVFVEDALVGVMRFALLKDGMTVAGTLYACPVETILEKAADLLPVPDPCFGLPGLPRQPLPSDPYRNLARFTSKDAEIFFGRNREIRQLYDRLTAPDAPHLTLLYGQSGVGKSSFLDAGVVPRLQWHYQPLYLRRDPQRSLLDSLQQALDPGDGLTARWLATEQRAGKPLIVFFDQLEETFTIPCTTAPNELAEFIAAIRTLPGRLVLAFRKEWFPEIQKQVEEAAIDYGKVFLEAVESDAIAEVVTGLTQTRRLREFYNLTIDPELPEAVAHDLADRNSPIAPTLQILLTKLWRSAIAADARAPRMTGEMYRRLQQEGLLLGDFLDQQLKELAKKEKLAEESGLALDILTYHTTPLLTAQQRMRDELLTTYAHRSGELPALVQQMERLYLLSDSSSDTGDKATRLSHDTLAPFVRRLFDRSDRAGQRARRIMASRVDDWDGADQNSLDAASLAAVERGQIGMRDLSQREQELLAASRRKYKKDSRRGRILKIIGATFVILITVLAIVIWNLYIRAKFDEHLSDWRYRAASAQMLLPRSPLTAMLTATSAAGDSYHAAASVIADVQFALSSAMIEAMETAQIDSSGKAVALSPDGLTIATALTEGNMKASRAVVKFWDRHGAPTGSFTQPVADPEFVGVNHIAFNPDGNLLALAGAGLMTWNREHQSPSAADSFGGVRTGRTVRSAAFTPDGKYLVSAEADGVLYVWSLDGREVAKVQADHGQKARPVLFSREFYEGDDEPPSLADVATARGPKDETLIATAGAEGVARLWRLDSGRLSLLKDLPGGWQMCCVAIAVRQDQILVAAGDVSGAVRLWNQQGTPADPYYFPDFVRAIAFQPNSPVIAAAAKDGVVRFIGFNGTEIAPAFRGVPDFVWSLHFLPDGRGLVAGAFRSVRVLDTGLLGGGRHIAAFDAFRSSGPVAGAAFLKGGGVAAGMRNGDILLWYPQNDAVHRIEHASTAQLERLTANRQGTMLAAASVDGRIHLFDEHGAKTGELPPSADSPHAPVAMVFSPDSKMLAAAYRRTDTYRSGHIAIWDLATHRTRALIRNTDEDSDQQVLAFTGSGDRLAAVPDNRPVLHFFRLDGSAAGDLLNLQGSITALAFRSDGQGFVTGESEGLLRRWTMDGKPVEPVVRPSKKRILWAGVDAGSSVIFVVDENGPGIGKYPVPGSSDLVELVASYDMPLQIASAALSPEDDSIVTVDPSGVSVWPAHWSRFLRETCERLRYHGVWNNPAYAEGFPAASLPAVRAFCTEQVWKQ